MNRRSSAIFAAALGASCCHFQAVQLPVALHPQETGVWCWAASGQMIMDYLGHDQAQCRQADLRFNQTNCPCTMCTNPPANPPSECIQAGWPEFEKYGFDYHRPTSDAPLSWGNLRAQIADKQTPFAFSWLWPGGGGHMMVAKGFLAADSTNYVEILNPWAPCAGDEEVITYDWYVEGPGHHTHYDDYYDIVYVGAPGGG